MRTAVVLVGNVSASPGQEWINIDGWDLERVRLWDSLLKAKRLQGTMVLTAGQLRYMCSMPDAGTFDRCSFGTREGPSLAEAMKSRILPPHATKTKEDWVSIVGVSFLKMYGRTEGRRQAWHDGGRVAQR